MPWKPKLTEQGQIEVKDGLPVFVDPDGKDSTFDPNSMHAKLIELGRENKTVRERFEGAQAKLKVFDGIEDLSGYKTKAEEAFETLKNLKDSKQIHDAEKVEAIKADMRKASDELESKLKLQFSQREGELQETVKKKERQLRNLIISNEFARSPFFAGADPKTTLPVDAAEALFGRHFEVRENKEGGLMLVALDDHGEPILSREHIGENAGFNEAISIFIDRYPHKDAIMKAKGGGSGGTGGVGSHHAPASALAQLKQQHAEAVNARDGGKAILLKNKIVALEAAERKR